MQYVKWPQVGLETRAFTACAGHEHELRANTVLVAFILNLRLGSLPNHFLHRPSPFLPDWFHGLTDVYSAQRLDLFAWYVRLSRLLVGFRTHFKSLHFLSFFLSNTVFAKSHRDLFTAFYAVIGAFVAWITGSQTIILRDALQARCWQPDYVIQGRI